MFHNTDLKKKPKLSKTMKITKTIVIAKKANK